MYVLFLRYPVPCNGIVYMDRLTNQSRGFGFIEMPDEEASKKAIAELDGATVLVYLS
jgi:RNA recognition motif-containing protein